MTSEFASDWDLAWTQLWQVTVVIGVAAMMTRLGCRRRPHLAYLLWLLVFVKCWIPPVWSSPAGVFCWLGGERLLAQEAAIELAAPTAAESDAGAAVYVANSRQEPFDLDAPVRGASATSAVPGTASIRSPQSPIWPSAIFAIWFAGVIVLVAVTWIRLLAWRRRLFRTAHTPDARVASLVADLAARLGLRRNVQVLVSSEAIGPAVFGVVRPSLVLPALLLHGDKRDGLAAILAHELVHVRRGDLLVGWLQLATQIVWWFHPLVWWSGIKLAQERERCCDEEAVAGLRCDPAAYAQTLLDVMKMRRRLRPLLTCPGIRAAEVTLRRLEHIVRFGAQARSRTPRVYWIAAAALFLLLAPGAAFRASGAAEPQGVAGEPEGNVLASLAESAVANGGHETTTAKTDDGETDRDENAPAPGREKAAKISPEHVQRAIAYLKNEQRADGSWPDPVGYPGGITALCTLALLRSGVAAGDPAIDRALAYLRKLQPEMTYSTALATMVFCEAGLEEDRRLVKRNIDWFEKAQKTEGPMQGAWGYPQAEGDNSNTGFAVMALYSADRAGIRVAENVWRRMLDYWVKTQNVAGSWGYKPGTPGTGSMTCEGAFCVAAAARVLDDADVDAAAQQALAKATQWLATLFSPAVNPGTSGAQGWQFYYLFAASEAGRMAKLKKFGEHDWRQEGAKELLARQEPNGWWKGRGHAEDNPHYATSMALLFFRQD